jgi:hypothetical protein
VVNAGIFPPLASNIYISQEDEVGRMGGGGIFDYLKCPDIYFEETFQREDFAK